MVNELHTQKRRENSPKEDGDDFVALIATALTAPVDPSNTKVDGHHVVIELPLKEYVQQSVTSLEIA